MSGRPPLTVWFGPMPESNGKSNFTAILHRVGECLSTGITIDRSEYPERVRYEADRMSYLIGERVDEPDILSYDADLHTGYVHPERDVDRQLREMTDAHKQLVLVNQTLRGNCKALGGEIRRLKRQRNAAMRSIDDAIVSAKEAMK